MLALADVQSAHQRIESYIHRTPTLTSHTLDEMCGGELVFKCENFQKIGAFKARGAHKRGAVTDNSELSRGVVTHSSGKSRCGFGSSRPQRWLQSLRRDARQCVPSKIESVRRLGGEITFCQATSEAREATAAKVQAATGATLVHPFDNWQVIAGQGTAALELVEDHDDLDAIVAPVGGGGLLAGTAIVGQAQNITVFGAEPSGADDAQRSLRSGQLQSVGAANTVADGLRTSLAHAPLQ